MNTIVPMKMNPQPQLYRNDTPVNSPQCKYGGFSFNAANTLKHPYAKGNTYISKP
jgi:hypothetical protein